MHIMSQESNVSGYVSPRTLRRKPSTQDSFLSSPSGVEMQMYNRDVHWYDVSIDAVQQWLPLLTAQPPDTNWYNASQMMDTSLSSSFCESSFMEQSAHQGPSRVYTGWDNTTLSTSPSAQMLSMTESIATTSESPVASFSEFSLVCEVDGRKTQQEVN